MRCPSCGQDNRERARFCDLCASPLAAVCDSCGAELRAGARFCDACGAPVAAAGGAAPAVTARTGGMTLPDHLAEKVRAAGASLAGERKRVTVLFADVQGSMELAGSLDPEDWRELMDRFVSILCAGVHRFEGTVDKFTGDGIMALFGAPLAHEDHAARACYAALHLRDELARYAAELRRERGLSFSVRMGINSGEVVVGAIGEDLSLDYTAVGQTVGLAQRMESLAEPGKVYVTDHTAALVPGLFELPDLGEFAVKGVAEPVRVFELERASALHTRIEVAAAQGLSRFVGRVEEMSELEHAWERAAAGDGQVVGVVGEAGVGKSRLCYEFAERCRTRGVDVYQAHALAHAKSVPFLPVVEFLRGVFDVSTSDDDRAAREKVAGRLLLLDDSFREFLPLVFDFLGVSDPERPAPPMDPEARQRQLFGTLDRLLRARSDEAPAVELVEDLHWLDPGSEAFLAKLVEWIPETRSLLLVTFRPEYRANWMQHFYFRRLPLRPLRPEAIDELLADLLGADPSLDGLSELVRERAGGNPLFIEEIVRALVEGGTLDGSPGAYGMLHEVSEVAIPATVESVLAARIDRLPEQDKTVLQTAAVIGRQFAEPVLRRVCGLAEGELEASLHALVAAELLYQRALYPEAEYAFKHALTEEVAYRSQVARRRAGIHAAVARAIEEFDAERLDERAPLLTHHWEAAGEPLQAARWGARAAGWAGYNDPAEAARYWRKVRQLTADAVDEEATTLGLTARIMLLDLALRLGAPSDDETAHLRELAALLAEGEALAGHTTQPSLRALMLVAYAGAVGVTGRYHETLGIAQRGLRLAEEAGDRGVYLAVACVVSHALWVLGRLSDALATVDRALAMAKGERSLGAGIGFVSPYAMAMMLRGFMLSWMGRLAEGREQLEVALKEAREAGDVEVQGWAHLQLVSIAAFGAADPEFALAHARAFFELAERAGGVFSQIWAHYAIAVSHEVRAEWPRCADAVKRTLALARERRTALEGEPMMLAELAAAQLGSGDPAAARATADEAIRLSVARESRVFEAMGRHQRARTLLASEGATAKSAIRSELQRALELFHQTGMRSDQPHVHAALAELAAAVGDEAAAERELRTARQLCEEIGATPDSIPLTVTIPHTT